VQPYSLPLLYLPLIARTKSMALRFLGFVLCAGLITLAAAPASAQHQHPMYWDVHDPDRPQPQVIDPGPAPNGPIPAPDDATVLFDGTDLQAWEHADTSAALWTVTDGAVEVQPGTGNLRTKRSFGDVQLHLEFATPPEDEDIAQGKGNSGVFLMGKYEVQILDSYQNQTYPDGQCAAIYSQYPPLVNASRPPGEWQTYDIVFRRPHFDEDGGVVTPARMTVFHNGVLVQDNVELTGPTAYMERPDYQPHAAQLPLQLQDHGNRVRYRNIWVRELE